MFLQPMTVVNLYMTKLLDSPVIKQILFWDFMFSQRVVFHKTIFTE